MFYLSSPSKMPCKSWGLPVSSCKTGQKLMKKPNTVCSSCYAAKGFFRMPTVQSRLDQNLQGWLNAPTDEWIAFASATLKEHALFRWFHSGDLQSGAMLTAICKVAENTPNTRHWLPTREFAFLTTARSQRKQAPWPDNLCIRLSQHTVNPKRMMKGKAGIMNFSSVVTENGSCPSQAQHGFCNHPTDPALNCRACWDTRVSHTSYNLH